MQVMLLFLAGVGLVMLWWLAGQRLMSKPWLEAETAHAGPVRERSPVAPIRIGLFVFLGVVGALFSLSISAYFMRMASSDWWAVPVPRLLWVNTAVLVASSAAMQWAKIEAGRDHLQAMRQSLGAGLLFGILFLTGQFQAWRELVAAGYGLSANPANSFFYMLTGLHGIHILGGLLVLGRTTARAFLARSISGRLRQSVDLCAIYWHFMLIVWLVLFALFAGWANDFADLCRQLLT